MMPEPRHSHGRGGAFLARLRTMRSGGGSMRSAKSLSQRRRQCLSTAEAAIQMRGERSIIESEHGGVYPQPRSREGQRRTCPYILAPCKPDSIRCITFHGGSARRHDCAASGAGCGRRAERAYAHAFEFLGMVAHRLTRGGGFRGCRDRLVARACRVATWCAVQRVAKPVS